MTWFSFQGGYGTIDFTGVNEKAAVALGFHGYATEAQAEAKPNSVNALQAPELDTLIANQAGTIPSVPGDISPAAGAAAEKDLSYALSISGIAGWFFRGLKIVFGGILIIIGISKLTGADNKITQMATKAAPLLVAA